MQNSLGTLIAIALVAGGFSLTGDLGWCARRGLQLVQQARPVDRPAAADAAPQSPPAVEADAPDVEPAVEEAPPAAPSSAAVPAEPAPESSPAPVPTTRRAIPTGGPNEVVLTALAPGARLVVWSRSGGRAAVCHVFDIIDPASGESLVSRRSVEEEVASADTAPRRVRLVASAGRGAEGDTPTVLTCGGRLQLLPLGLAHDRAAAAETVGPIIALAVD